MRFARVLLSSVLGIACGDESVPSWTTDDLPDGVTPAGGGIRVTELWANQGVAVKLGTDGVVVDPAARNARLVADRSTLFRALWAVPADWVARDIEAHLTIEYPDGSGDTVEQTLTITAAADPERIDGTFSWLIPAEFIRPGMAVSVLLGEVDDNASDLPVDLPRLPVKGETSLGITGDPHVLRVRLIPISHELDGLDCPGPPQLDQALVELFRDRLFAYNPVQRVDIEVRDVFVYRESSHDFDALLDTIAQLRTTDGAGPELYYYGLIRTCDGGEEDVGGKAIAIPQEATVDNAWQRTAVGRFHPMAAGGAIETFIHEVGHTQGRRHAPCGEAGGPDPDYPYVDADIGVYGFHVLDRQLKPPTYKDYMGYCGPTWVSDYGWELVYDRIATISSWSSRVSDESSGHGLLVGSWQPGAKSRWWTSSGSASCEHDRAGHALHFVGEDGSTLRLPACVEARPDSSTFNVYAAVPGPFVRVEHEVDGHRVVIEPGALRRVLDPSR